MGMARGDIDAHVPAAEFPTQNQLLQSWKATYTTFSLDIWYLQPRPFTQNTAYNFARGVQTYYVNTEFHRQLDDESTDPNLWFNNLPDAYKDQLDMVFDNTILWNIGRRGFMTEISTNITIQNSRVVGYNSRTGFENYGTNPAPAYVNDEPEVIGIDLDHYHNTHRWNLNNNIVEGFSGNAVGVALPINALVTMNGGTFNNPGTDIQIGHPSRNIVNDEGEGFGVGMLSVPPTKSEVTITGNITFQDPSNNIVMLDEIIYDEIPSEGFPLLGGAKQDPIFFFAPLEVTLNFGPFQNVKAYFDEQDAAHIPIVSGGNNCAISSPEDCVNNQYVGKTNAQLQAQFNISFLGTMTPNSATTNNMVIGGKIDGTVLGVEDVPVVEDACSIYPNPASDSFQIRSDFTNHEVRIYSMIGQLVQNNSSLTSVNISNLPQGIYLVNIYDKATRRTCKKKLIKR